MCESVSKILGGVFLVDYVYLCTKLKCFRLILETSDMDNDDSNSRFMLVSSLLERKLLQSKP